jgi:hypothetical protein
MNSDCSNPRHPVQKANSTRLAAARWGTTMVTKVSDLIASSDSILGEWATSQDWCRKPMRWPNLWTGRRVTRDTEGMVKSVEGIYRNGRVELVEPLAEAEGSRVIVTWVHSSEPVDLRERGIDESQAADLRRRLSAFAEDWDRPDMAAYDDLPPR